MAGDEGDGGGVVAVGDRDPGVGGRRDAGGHPRHDLELDPGRAQRLALLAAAAEDERVAALEPHDALARRGRLDQPLADLLLGNRGNAGLLADVDQLGVGAGAASAPGGIRPVVEDRVGEAISSSERAVINPGSPGPAPTR